MLFFTNEKSTAGLVSLSNMRVFGLEFGELEQLQGR